MNNCTYCVNEPKKASYLIDGKSLVCKSCIDSTILQKFWKSNNSTIQYIQDKQVNRYNLPLDHKYKIVGFDYAGSILDGGGAQCENCGRIIVNLAYVENEQGKKYTVGCDCAETLSLVDCNDFWKIKEQEALMRKVSKTMRDIRTWQKEGKFSVFKNDNGVWIYSRANVTEWDVNYRIRMGHEFFNQYYAKHI